VELGMARLSVASAVVLACARCGKRMLNPGVTAELRCAACGSEKMVPVPLWGGSVEYALADRSQGYALEDIRFGKIATWAGLISLNQYNDAMAIQKECLGLPGRIPSLAEIMIQKKFLTRAQVEAVLQARVEAADDPSDDEFGKLAMDKSGLTQARYISARQVQLEYSTKKREVPPLPVVVYEKRYMQEKEIQAVLQYQEQQRRGQNYRIKKELEGQVVPTSERLFGVKGSAGRRTRLIGAGLAGLVLLVFLIVSLWGTGDLVLSKCTNPKCGKRYTEKLKSDWPVYCPACKERTIEPFAVCLKCGEEFTIANIASLTNKCPKCGSSQYSLETKKVNVAEIKAKAKAAAPKAKPKAVIPGG
jgi:DNA-directed RNA polymerase subunit RPC12/RpoP